MKRFTSVRFLAALMVVGGASVGMLAQSSFVAAAQGTDRFQPLGPDKAQANSNDSLFYPNDFEAATASRPDPNGLTFFSECRRAPFTSTTLYSAFTGVNADAIVGDTVEPKVDGHNCYQPQNEQNIVINPNNNQNVVTSANDYRYGFQALVYTSTDGGHTWTDVLLPGWSPATGGTGRFKIAPAGGDPVLAFAPDGTLYYAALVYTFYANRTDSGVAVASSQDGGLHWSSPVMVHYEAATNFFNDKDWIAAGANGNVYVTWTRFNQGPHGAGYISSNIVLAASHDHGATWSDPIAVSDSAHPFDQGSSPAVAPDGTVYVAYEGNQADNVSRDQTVLARSTDGGRKFTNTELGRVFDDFPACYPLNVAQGRFRLSFEQFRLSSFPSLAIDPTNGHMAITWADDQLNSGCGSNPGSTPSASAFTGLTDNQVKLITSTNGTTWTAPSFITSGPGDKAYPAAAANDGRIVVGYYTRDYATVPTADHRCSRGFLDTSDPNYPNSPAIWDDSHNVCLDYAISSSTDGFASETRVSTESSNPYIDFSGSFIGDYTGVAVDSTGAAHAAWTDSRGNPTITTPNQDTVVGNGF